MIHPTAIVDKASLPHDIEIGPYSIIDPTVILGSGCKIGAFVHIKGNTTIGNNNQFFDHCTIGEAAQDIHAKVTNPRIEIKDNNIFREYFTAHQSTKDDKPTRIGSNNYFMCNAHCAHDVQVGNNVIFVNYAGIAGHAIVEDNAYISAFSMLHQHTRMGSFAMLAPNSKGAQDIPPYVLAKGSTGAAINLNIVALRRAGFSAEALAAIKKTFKLFFLTKDIRKTAIAKIENEILGSLNPNSEAFNRVKVFVDFVSSSKRGIISHVSKKSQSDDE